MKFDTNNKSCINLNTGYHNKKVEALTTKFLGLQVITKTGKSTLNTLSPN
jgi:hypothetical protein